MRIPFDIKFRPQVESGEYKVETRDCRPVCITCWDAEAINPKEFKGIKILAYHTNSESKLQFGYNENGKFSGFPSEDLFIVTPDPELTEFEQAVRKCVTEHLTTHIKDGNGREMSSTVFIDDDTARAMAAELLELARKELKKTFVLLHKDDYQTAFDLGKAEALKDLPRWKKIGRGNNYSSEVKFAINGRYLEMNDTLNNVYEVALSDLEKLPKED